MKQNPEQPDAKAPGFSVSVMKEGVDMGKKYNAEETILLALYAEWISDYPDNGRVNEVTLQLEPEVFLWGLMKLKRTGMIDGISWQPDYAAMPNQVRVLSREFITLTEKGVETAKELSETSKKRAEEACKIVAGIFKELGIAAFSGLIIK